MWRGGRRASERARVAPADLWLFATDSALSVFATRSLPNATPFTSILSIDPLVEASCSPSRIHAIYGASKDWGANGLRLGALVSQSNPELHTAMESSCLLMKVSSVAVRVGGRTVPSLSSTSTRTLT